MVIVVLSSITSANRVKLYIKLNYNIDVYIMQTPKSLQIEGCGYAIKTEYKNLDIVFEAIGALKIATKGAFDAQTYKKIK